MRVLIVQLPVGVLDASVLLVGMNSTRPMLAMASHIPIITLTMDRHVPIVMLEDLTPVVSKAYLEVSEVLAIMKAGASREDTLPEERMPFPKARTRRRDEHRFSPDRQRRITAHGRPRFYRRQIG